MSATVAQDPAPSQVSLVMPVLNGMPWIAEAVASVAAQTVPTELIILDGGSTDGTRDWLARHAPSWACVVAEHDRGQSDAIANGLAMARGAILGWLNADDLLERGALATVVAAFEAHPDAPIVSGACATIDGQGVVTGRIELPPDGSLAGLLSCPRNLPQPATFFSARAYRQTSGVDRRLRYAMDVDLWLKLARFGPALLLPDQVLARFRVHASAKSTVAATAMVREDLRVRWRHGMPVLSRTSAILMRRAYLRPAKQWLARRLPVPSR